MELNENWLHNSARQTWVINEDSYFLKKHETGA